MRRQLSPRRRPIGPGIERIGRSDHRARQDLVHELVPRRLVELADAAAEDRLLARGIRHAQPGRDGVPRVGHDVRVVVPQAEVQRQLVRRLPLVRDVAVDAPVVHLEEHVAHANPEAGRIGEGVRRVEIHVRQKVELAKGSPHPGGRREGRPPVAAGAEAELPRVAAGRVRELLGERNRVPVVPGRPRPRARPVAGMLLLRPEVQRIAAVQAGNHVRLRVERIDPRVGATEQIAGGLPQVLNGAAHLDLVEHPAVQHGGPLEVVDRLFRQFVAKVLGDALLDFRPLRPPRYSGSRSSGN